jgi:hypothetical protein
MYQANLPHILAKTSPLPSTLQDYNAALANAGNFLAEIEKAHANPLPGDPLMKSTFSESSSPTSGLTYYDLETGAKFVYPLLTPLRNEVPSVSGKGGVQANWRAVTGINTIGLRIGVSGGNRGGVQAVSTQDYSAAYKGIGIETSVDFEAQYAGMGFDDIRAIGAKIGLEACMLGEELLILGGNTSVPLGTTPTPSLVPSTSGGSLTAAASPYSVICVALSLDAIVNGSVTGGIQGAITRSNGEVCDYASTKPLYQKWSQGFASATDGRSLGNLRAMHGAVAAGKLIEIAFNDALKQVEICGKVVDDAEWQKVEEGVYTGFSQGGRYLKRWPDPDQKRCHDVQ